MGSPHKEISCSRLEEGKQLDEKSASIMGDASHRSAITNLLGRRDSVFFRRGLVAFIFSTVLLVGGTIACSILGTGKSEIRFSVRKDGYLPAEDLRVSFSDEKQTRSVNKDDFKPVSFDSGRLCTQKFETVTTDTISVAFSVIADGAVGLPVVPCS